jgi:hypothetical protein
MYAPRRGDDQMKNVLPLLFTVLLLAACGPQESDTGDMMDDSGVMEESAPMDEMQADSTAMDASEMGGMEDESDMAEP